jgi:hypothetical protein
VLVGYVLSYTPRIVAPAIILGESGTTSLALQVFADLGNDAVRDAVHARVAAGQLRALNGALFASSAYRGASPGCYTGVGEIAPEFLGGFPPREGSEGGSLSDASIAAQAAEAASPSASSAPDLVALDAASTASTEAQSPSVPAPLREVLRSEDLNGQPPEEPQAADAPPPEPFVE